MFVEDVILDWTCPWLYEFYLHLPVHVATREDYVQYLSATEVAVKYSPPKKWMKAMNSTPVVEQASSSQFLHIVQRR